MADIPTEDLARAAADLVISRLAEKYELVYIDRGNYLADEAIHKLFAGEGDVLDDDWLFENKRQGTKHVLENLLDEDARQFLEDHDALDRVTEEIENRDYSDPIGDLMRETGSKLFRYRLDGESPANSWEFSDDQLTEAARALAEAAGIDFWDNTVALRELVANASYGGGLYVLWRGDIKPVYDAVCKRRFHDPAPEITVQWTDPDLLVLDQWNGSGHVVRVRGTVRVPFAPDLLALDIVRGPGGYSWADVVGGGYQPESSEPEFIYPNTENEEVQHG